MLCVAHLTRPILNVARPVVSVHFVQKNRDALALGEITLRRESRPVGREEGATSMICAAKGVGSALANEPIS